jgi:hypothetical protein
LRGGLNTYGYVAGTPISNYDANGLECTSASGMTTCAYPGGPTFRVPTPPGFPASIGEDSLLYHKYDVGVPLECASPQDVFRELLNHPTPSHADAASGVGTQNDARVAPFWPNPVTSYLTTDLNTGTPLVVNITGVGSQFSPGYVARQVRNGAVHTYGEGQNFWQSPLIFGQPAQDFANWWVWGRQMRSIVDKTQSRCSCE